METFESDSKSLYDFLTALKVTLTSAHCTLRTTTESLKDFVSLIRISIIIRRESPPVLTTITSLITGCNRAKYPVCRVESVSLGIEEAVDERHNPPVLGEVLVLEAAVSHCLLAGAMVSQILPGVRLTVNLVSAASSQVLAGVRLVGFGNAASSGGGEMRRTLGQSIELLNDTEVELTEVRARDPERLRGFPLRPPSNEELGFEDTRLRLRLFVIRDMNAPSQVGERGRQRPEADHKDWFSITNKEFLPATAVTRRHETAGLSNRGVISKVELVQVDTGGSKEREQEQPDHFLHTFWRVEISEQIGAKMSSSDQVQIQSGGYNQVRNEDQLRIRFEVDGEIKHINGHRPGQGARLSL